MEIIPAIDLKDGVVVSTLNGKRDLYQPLHNDLFRESDILYVIQQISSLFEFHKVYIADLNAIEKRGNNEYIIKQIENTYPKINILLDNGIIHHSNIKPAQQITSVVGTETLKSSINKLKAHHYILSLDFNDNTLLGYDALTHIDDWPETIIVLSLDRVGQSNGMHFELLKQLRSKYQGFILAGGGLQDVKDIQRLKEIGINGVLIGNAIYSGKINTHTLAKIN